MPNNRKSTRGRVIQMIKDPLTVKRTIKVDGEEKEVTIPNPRRSAGGTIKVTHKVIKN